MSHHHRPPTHNFGLRFASMTESKGPRDSYLKFAGGGFLSIIGQIPSVFKLPPVTSCDFSWLFFINLRHTYRFSLRWSVVFSKS